MTKGRITTIRGLGIAELILGFLIIVLSVGSFRPWTGYPYLLAGAKFSFGLWAGIFPIISGALGAALRSENTNKLLNPNLGMSILGAVFMLVSTGGAVFSAIAVVFVVRDLVFMVLQSIVAILSFGTMIVCIVHSVFSCIVRSDEEEVKKTVV